MKINDILECINRTLDEERKAKGLTVVGFFTTYTSIKKLMGNYKEITVYIGFYNGETNIKVSKVVHTIQGDNTEQVELMALQNLISILTHGVDSLEYKRFLEGTYAGIEQ